MHPPTSPPRQRKRLLYATAIFVAMLLCAGALWGWRTYTHARNLRDHTSTLTVALASDVAMVDSSLAAIASDLDALQRDLRLPLPVAQHLRWVPKYGPAIAAVPEALCAAELAVSGLQRTWSVIGLPLFALRENPTDSAWQGVVDAVADHSSELSAAADSLRSASQILRDDDVTPLVYLAAARNGLTASQADDLVWLLAASSDMLDLLPDLLCDDMRTWLVLAQNSDELRPTGGFISSIAAWSIGSAPPTFGPFRDSYAIENWEQPHPDPPQALREQMGLDLWVTRDANWWPDFPSSAEAVAEMYQLNQQTPVAGVIAVDLLGAADILEAISPLTTTTGLAIAPDQTLATLRDAWSLDADALITAGTVFTATTHYNSVQVRLTFSDRDGTAWFDDVVLARAAAPDVNLLQNGSFEDDADGDGLPDVWTAIGLGENDLLVSDQAYDGSVSLRVEGQPDVNKSLLQRLPISGDAGDAYLVSAVSRADGVPLKGGNYAVHLDLIAKDGSADRNTAPFPMFDHDWATAGTARTMSKWYRERKGFLGQIAGAASARLMRADRDTLLDLISATRQAFDERHIQLYARNDAIQDAILRQGWAGDMPAVAGDSLAVVDANVGYNKTNASVTSEIAYSVDLDYEPSPLARLTLTYVNHSPPDDRPCDKFHGYAPTYRELVHGCHWNYARIYVPEGAQILSIEGGDAPLRTVDDERGAEDRLVWAVPVLLRPGEERSIGLEYTLPHDVVSHGEYRLDVRKQAGTGAMPLSVTVSGAFLQPTPIGLQPTDVGPSSIAYASDLRIDREIHVLVQR